MSDPEAGELAKGGEGRTVELKRSVAEMWEGLEALCDMLNSGIAEGVVVFGVRPDGAI